LQKGGTLIFQVRLDSLPACFSLEAGTNYASRAVNNLTDKNGDTSYSSLWRSRKRIKYSYVKAEDYQPVDEGGPTREFFNQIFSQLGNLEVRFNEKTGVEEPIKLYEMSSGGFSPITDDILQNKLRKVQESERADFERKIACYYRCIGRLIVHCMLSHSKLIGKIDVPSQVLPLLFQSGKKIIGISG